MKKLYKLVVSGIRVECSVVPAYEDNEVENYEKQGFYVDPHAAKTSLLTEFENSRADMVNVFDAQLKKIDLVIDRIKNF